MPPRRSFRARAPLRQQDQSEQAEIADQEIIGDVVQHVLFGRRADMSLREIVGPPFAVLAVRRRRAPALIEAEQGQRRHQHRRRQQKGARRV